MQKTRAAVVGASGYSGEELLRLLAAHPFVETTCVTSRKYAGTSLGEVFPRFAESSLTFSEPDVKAIAEDADVAFLALPHGLATDYAVPLLKAGLRLVDISADFRIRLPEVYELYYEVEHPAPELLHKAVYGLPERYRQEICDAHLVACPGCYPTSILLPLCPLLAARLVGADGIAAVSMSGVTGAGRKVDLPYIFPECNESVRPYKVTGHRHLPEIEQELALAAECKELSISFVPHLIPVSRGIHSTILANSAPGASADKVHETLRRAYQDEPFVRVLPPGKLADTKNVTLTNFCEIGCAMDGHTGRVIISSAIDNLTKGASGQAIQCLNIMCGFPETAGLLPCFADS